MSNPPPAPTAVPAQATRPRWLTTITMAVFAVLFAVATVEAVDSAATGNDLTVGAHPVAERATVIDTYPATRRTDAALLVRFTTQDGKTEFEDVDDNTDNSLDLPGKGTKVAVLYKASDPSQIILASDRSTGWAAWLGAVICGLLALLLFGLVVARLKRLLAPSAGV